jgi:hypothetical protein
LEEDCQTAVPDSESADRSGLAGWQRKPVAWAVFFEEPYLAVLRMDEPFVARTLRAVHCYASGALVVTTLLHAYRTLFMERFSQCRLTAPGQPLLTFKFLLKLYFSYPRGLAKCHFQAISMI